MLIFSRTVLLSRARQITYKYRAQYMSPMQHRSAGFVHGVSWSDFALQAHPSKMKIVTTNRNTLVFCVVQSFSIKLPPLPLPLKGPSAPLSPARTKPSPRQKRSPRGKTVAHRDNRGSFDRGRTLPVPTATVASSPDSCPSVLTNTKRITRENRIPLRLPSPLVRRTAAPAFARNSI